MSKWVRDYLVLPLVVGLILAAVTFGLSRLFAEKLELSYEVDGPTRYLNGPAVQGLEVTVNGKPAREVVAYRIRIWNSGDKPIKKLLLRLIFNNQPEDFEVFALRHNTTPEYEFGAIAEFAPEKSARRFEYELLNANDQDVVTILTNAVATISLFAKAEGLKVVQRQPGEGPFAWLKFPSIVALAALASVLAELLKSVHSAFIVRMRKRSQVDRSEKGEGESTEGGGPDL